MVELYTVTKYKYMRQQRNHLNIASVGILACIEANLQHKSLLSNKWFSYFAKTEAHWAG